MLAILLALLQPEPPLPDLSPLPVRSVTPLTGYYQAPAGVVSEDGQETFLLVPPDTRGPQGYRYRIGSDGQVQTDIPRLHGALIEGQVFLGTFPITWEEASGSPRIRAVTEDSRLQGAIFSGYGGSALLGYEDGGWLVGWYFTPFPGYGYAPGYSGISLVHPDRTQTLFAAIGLGPLVYGVAVPSGQPIAVRMSDGQVVFPPSGKYNWIGAAFSDIAPAAPGSSSWAGGPFLVDEMSETVLWHDGTVWPQRPGANPPGPGDQVEVVAHGPVEVLRMIDTVLLPDGSWMVDIFLAERHPDLGTRVLLVQSAPGAQTWENLDDTYLLAHSLQGHALVIGYDMQDRLDTRCALVILDYPPIPFEPLPPPVFTYP